MTHSDFKNTNIIKSTFYNDVDFIKCIYLLLLAHT